jgi:hypothetical protein
MNILSWNCRGSGGSGKIQFLKNPLRSTQADIAFISETRSGVQRAVHQLQSFPDFNWHLVSSVGLSGGLWLFWVSSVKISILEADKHFIFAQVGDTANGGWVLGAIYGDASHTENPRIWRKI